jgi:ankyrin repeat protein
VNGVLLCLLLAAGQPPPPLQVELQRAARAGDFEQVKTALDAGAPVDSPGPGGSTPLMTAARFGHLALLELLLQRGAALEARDTLGRTPLWSATFGRQDAVVALLVLKGADVNATDAQGDPLLPYAADVGALGIVKQLIAAGVPVDARTKNTTWPGYTAAMNAVKRGHRDVLDALLLAGADPRAKNATGQGLLSLAVGRGDMALLRFLVEDRRLLLDEPDNFGRTPLMFAALDGAIEPLRYLLSRGADWRLKDSHGDTALTLARSKPELLAVLVEWEKTRPRD